MFKYVVDLQEVYTGLENVNLTHIDFAEIRSAKSIRKNDKVKTQEFQ